MVVFAVDRTRVNTLSECVSVCFGTSTSLSLSLLINEAVFIHKMTFLWLIVF